MIVLLLSTYELGHQPINLAWPAAALEAAGFSVQPYDLSVQRLPAGSVKDAGLVAFSAPMHTALRLAVPAARRIRRLNPDAHICFYGLYAQLNASYLFDSGLADSVTAGEVEPVLAALAGALQGGTDPAEIPGLATPGAVPTPALERWEPPIPARAALSGLEDYARLDHNGRMVLAGYTESTRGCLHTCRHCPVVPVYGGRFFAVPAETVLADIRQQVAAGAAHIVFGDPDFLNGPTHALRIARALHDAHPSLTFSFTAKVEHLIKHRDLLPELVEAGLLFVISAFESTSNRVLAELDKGHTRADMDAALRIGRETGFEILPTWVAFTPWTTLDDYIDMLEWVWHSGLVHHVQPVQYAVRLLVPPGSVLLEGQWLVNSSELFVGSSKSAPAAPALGQNPLFTELDAENFSYTWHHPDPRMDGLHQAVSALVESAGPETAESVFERIAALAYDCAGLEAPSREKTPFLKAHPPRLTEDWFC